MIWITTTHGRTYGSPRQDAWFSHLSNTWFVSERFTRKFYWDAMGAVQPDDQERVSRHSQKNN